MHRLQLLIEKLSASGNTIFTSLEILPFNIKITKMLNTPFVVKKSPEKTLDWSVSRKIISSSVAKVEKRQW